MAREKSIKAVNTDTTSGDSATFTQVKAIMADRKYKDFAHFGARTGSDTAKPVDIISTGSFQFDYAIGGGFRSSSWCRFYGDPETGKSSMGLKWGANWQQFYGPKGYVVYFNAEGRLRREHVEGSGLDKERFIVIDTNVSDMIYSIIEDMVHNNPEGNKYFFIVDSTDACQRLQDKDKNIKEAEKIGGSATIMSAAGKRLSLVFDRTGHVLYMCSQVRDKVNTYSPTGSVGKSASGGNAPQFYSSLTGRIKKPWSETKIYEDPSDKKSKVIGHLVEILLEKTPNKTTGQTVTFPVKYDKVGGVWREYESYMVAETWCFLVQKGAYFYWSDDFLAFLKAKNIEGVPVNFQGIKRLIAFLESEPNVVEAIFEKVSQVI